MTEDLARDALAAQGFETPGPRLVQMVASALAREERTGAQARTDPFSFSAILFDTPELLARTEGSQEASRTEISRVLAGILTEAIRYAREREVSS